MLHPRTSNRLTGQTVDKMTVSEAFTAMWFLNKSPERLYTYLDGCWFLEAYPAELSGLWVEWTIPFHHNGGQNAGHEIIGEL